MINSHELNPDIDGNDFGAKLVRQVVLDTETTGLDPKSGHRLIELGCVELIDGKKSGKYFHHYINPEREIDAGAQSVHGITSDFLANKPKFSEIAEAFVEFIRGAELIIHNAAFDVGFLNNELMQERLPSVDSLCICVLDTLKLARQKHPGQRNNLDALCERYLIDSSNRRLHGAFGDAQLLAEVYLAMVSGDCRENGKAIAAMDYISSADTVQIPLEELQIGLWYVGRGRNSNVGLWNGEDFLVIGRCSHPESWEPRKWISNPCIKVEPYYTKTDGCFQPLSVIDEGTKT